MILVVVLVFGVKVSFGSNILFCVYHFIALL